MDLANRFGLLILVASCPLAACHQTYEPRSDLRMADPAVSSQLLDGFYRIEENSWRWAARNFSVALKPPAGAAERGGRLRVRLYLSADELQKLGPLTLTGTIDGKSIGNRTFNNAGTFDFTWNLAPETLDTNILPVQFCFDKAMTPADDKRELAAVMLGIAILPGQAPGQAQ